MLTDNQLAMRPAALGTPLPAKTAVALPDGTTYLDFRRTLRPRYASLWAQLGLTLAVAAAGLVLPIVVLGPEGIGAGIAIVVVLSVVEGVCLYVLSLFGHAAAHNNLAGDPVLNDRVANVLIFPVTGIPIDRYRRVHLAHHRLLGREGDPEDGYREPLDWAFALRCVLGRRFLDALLRHVGPGGGTDEPMSGHGLSWVTAAGALVHAAAVLVPFFVGAWYVSVAWILAFTIVAPTLIALRLVLEHRLPVGVGALDDGKDAVTRSFSGVLVAPVFGAGGFRSHLVHHWDPQVHCTRLRDVERFLAESGAREIAAGARMRYHESFSEIRG